MQQHIYYMNLSCYTYSFLFVSCLFPTFAPRNQNYLYMRFYEYWNGFLWEYNSLSEYLLALLGRLIGAIVGVVILFFLCCFFYYYGEGEWPELTPFWNLIRSFFEE